MTKTPIEWCDFTVNPFRFRNLATGKVGHHCTKISPGCKNCYSDKMQGGPYLSGLTFIAENKPKGEFFLDEKVLEKVLRRRKPARIFWWDMTDGFLEDYPDEWIDRCFATMALTPHLTHLVLTKRAERLRRYTGTACGRVAETHRKDMAVARMAPVKQIAAVKIARSMSFDESIKPLTWPLPNVWLGVSVEDQQRKQRIDLLRETPAAVRFVSFEPLLEDLGTLNLKGIDLAIWGGESVGGRPCDVQWIRNGMRQASAQGCKNFVKQLGSRPRGPEQSVPEWVEKLNAKGGNWEVWPDDLRVREMPGVPNAR